MKLQLRSCSTSRLRDSCIAALSTRLDFAPTIDRDLEQMHVQNDNNNRKKNQRQVGALSGL